MQPEGLTLATRENEQLYGRIWSPQCQWLKTTRLKNVSITRAVIQRWAQIPQRYVSRKTSVMQWQVHIPQWYVYQGSQRTNPSCRHLDGSSPAASEVEPDIDIDEVDELLIWEIDEANEEQVNKLSTELYYIDRVHTICVGYLWRLFHKNLMPKDLYCQVKRQIQA